MRNVNQMFGWVFLFGCLLCAGNTWGQAVKQDYAERWWKGNLHTHSFWSDGDDFPEMISDWYASHGYNFLALSDHNILSEGVRWMPAKEIFRRAEPDVLDQYRDRFGDAWVESRGTPGSPDYEIRLKPISEFARLVERADQFILIPAEEISARSEGKPVHMNATNVKDVIQPINAATVRETMQANLRQVLEQEEKTGRQILPHLNHPNFGYAVTAEDLANVIQEQFFEVYNGHPGVNQLGDETHVSIDRMWDLANAIRLTQLDAAPLLGIATDDSHEYHGRPGSQPGRGWVMVRSRYLTPEHLIRAMRRGDFYASSGVQLESIDWNPSQKVLSVEVQPEDGVQFTIQFIATLKPEREGEIPDGERIGKVIRTVEGLKASYRMAGNELYVRALITSDRKHPNPSLDSQKEQAWTQPVGWSTGDK